jgi:hypothetical protein
MRKNDIINSVCAYTQIMLYRDKVRDEINVDLKQRGFDGEISSFHSNNYKK